MGLIDRLFGNQDEFAHQENVKKADELFQIKEYGSELWLTYDGHLFCPCSMLNTGPVEAVLKMRELYVKRTEE